MFDSATLNLFAAITIFVIITVAGRDLLARGGLSTSLGQAISGLVGLAVASAFLLVVS